MGYERWLLMVAVAVGLLALRNWPFASLIAIMLIPVGLDRTLRRKPSRAVPWFGSLVALAAIAGAAAALVWVLSRPASHLTDDFPAQAAGLVQQHATAPADRVYASVKFADWLLELPRARREGRARCALRAARAARRSSNSFSSAPAAGPTGRW